MKRILIAALIMVAGAANAQQTLMVIEQDYELAKRTAQQQKKLLIVDFYTTWCVPCKMIDKAIFKNDSIAAEISKNFVVLRYDAEKDSTYNLSLKHHICSYPTTVVLTAEGSLIHKMFGTGGTTSLVENYTDLLRKSIQLHQQGKYITGFSTTIDPDIYPAFYKKYVRRTANIKPNDLNNYWENNTDLLSEVSLDILAYFGRAPERVANYFIQHKTDYEKRFGKPDVQFIIDQLVSEKFNAAITTKDEARYNVATKFAQQHLTVEDANRYINIYSLEMEIAKGAWHKASDLIEEQVRRKAISKNGINEFCWMVYQQCNEKNVIDRAVHLMKNITDTDPSFAMLDTYARLLSKNGNSPQAIAIMTRAIEIGKANNEDTKESEEALKKL